MTEETTVPPRRRREYKKRPPMDQAAIEGRRDFVVAYLDDHAGQSFSAMHLQEVLQQAGEDITVSGVRMMMWVLVNEERVQALHEGNLVRFSSKLSTPPVREPEPEQQQSLEEGMAELAKDATAALARVTPQPREEVKMTTPQTNGSHADADNQRIAELERENRILRNMVMRARGLTPEQFEMALDLAREMADQ